MPLHPQVAAFLEQLARQKTPSLDALPIEVSRRAVLIGAGSEPLPASMERIENRTITRPDGSELAIRIYIPKGNAPFGVCLYFHGGGWVLNSVDTHDGLVRQLAITSGCVFVNVEYRLAPEFKYPAAADDAYLAVQWVYEHAHELGCDPNRLAVSGDSAGGNLAAVACLMARDRNGPPIRFQALIYPITDCDFQRPSYQSNAEGYFLTRNEMIWFWNHYVSHPDQMLEAYASPIRATSHANLPPALVLTTELDPLRDEGEAYAKTLSDAGVRTIAHHYDGMIHAFMRRYQQFDTAYEAIRKVSQELRNALGL